MKISRGFWKLLKASEGFWRLPKDAKGFHRILEDSERFLKLLELVLSDYYFFLKFGNFSRFSDFKPEIWNLIFRFFQILNNIFLKISSKKFVILCLSLSVKQWLFCSRSDNTRALDGVEIRGGGDGRDDGRGFVTRHPFSLWFLVSEKKKKEKIGRETQRNERGVFSLHLLMSLYTHTLRLLLLLLLFAAQSAPPVFRHSSSPYTTPTPQGYTPPFPQWRRAFFFFFFGKKEKLWDFSGGRVGREGVGDCGIFFWN